MTEIQQIIDLAANLGVRAKLWQKDGRTRIYANTGSRRDLSVYLECEGIGGGAVEADGVVGGAVFKVYCATAQHPNWIKSQIALARENYIALWHAYVVVCHSDVGPQPNDFGMDINAMIDESRAFITARKRS